MTAPRALALLAAALALPAVARAAAGPLVLRFSHVVAPETPKGQAALRFKQLAEDFTGGAVRVEVYPNGELYRDREEMEALQLGAVQMLAPSLAKFAPLGVEEFELFDLPFLFEDHDQLHRITGGPIGRALLDRLEPKGILGLAYWDNGFKVMSANRPLRTPADFKGLKMRIQASEVLDAQMRAVGAIPQVTPFSAAYRALQTGVVDGTENPPSNLHTQRMDEVQRYVTLSNHGWLGYAVIVNRRFWTELPREVRTQLELALRQATAFADEMAARDNEEALAALRRAGRAQLLTLTPEERAAWRRAMDRAHQEQMGRIGADLVREVYDAVGYRAR